MRKRLVILSFPFILFIIAIFGTQLSTFAFFNVLHNTAVIAVSTPGSNFASKTSQPPRAIPVNAQDVGTQTNQSSLDNLMSNSFNKSHPDVQKTNFRKENEVTQNRSDSAGLVPHSKADVPLSKPGGTQSFEATADKYSNGNETFIRWHLPKSMHQYEPAKRNSTQASEISNHSWVQPLIMSSFVRRHNETSNETDVFVYATGVTMGNFLVQSRNFSVVGCVIGSDIYELDFHVMDVFQCTCDRIVSEGEHISLAVHYNDAVRKALNNATRLSSNYVMTLQDNKDVLALPSNTTFRSDLALNKSLSQNVSDYRQIRTVNSSRAIAEIPASLSMLQPRFEVCLLTMMKQFVNLLDDWIDYHRKLGVDQIFLIDNDAVEDLTERFSKRPDVTVIYWPFERSQVQALSLFTVALRPRCEWLLVWDADEYLMTGIGEGLQDAGAQIVKKLLTKRRLEGYDEIRFKYVTMGPSGHVYMPNKSVPEAYVFRYTGQKMNVKTALQTDREWMVSRVHYPKGRFWPKIYMGKKVNFEPTNMEDESVIVHYQYRSLEEAVLKAKYGSSSIGDKNLDLEEVSDTRNMSNPKEFYTVVNESLRYTHFRDIWRAVVATDVVQTRTIVMWVNGRRCSARYNDTDESFGADRCSNGTEKTS